MPLENLSAIFYRFNTNKPVIRSTTTTPNIEGNEPELDLFPTICCLCCCFFFHFEMHDQDVVIFVGFFFISFEKAVNCQFQNYVVDDAVVVVVASVIHVEYFIRNAQTAAKQKKST